jgi:hypothetical protein
MLSKEVLSADDILTPEQLAEKYLTSAVRIQGRDEKTIGEKAHAEELSKRRPESAPAANLRGPVVEVTVPSSPADSTSSPPLQSSAVTECV